MVACWRCESYEANKAVAVTAAGGGAAAVWLQLPIRIRQLLNQEKEQRLMLVRGMMMLVQGMLMLMLIPRILMLIVINTEVQAECHEGGGGIPRNVPPP